jgi:hypothetical protein
LSHSTARISMATHAARAFSSAVAVPGVSSSSSPSGTRASPASFRAKRAMASSGKSTSTAAGAAVSQNADNARCDTVVLDGANLAWTFSASLYAKEGMKCRTRLPLSRGLTLALEAEVWAEMGVKPIAFMPASYVEGPLHGLADGGSLRTLVPCNVEYQGKGVWRNVVLWELTEKGSLVTVKRPPGQRDADDKQIIAYARSINAMICSNDRFSDHIAGAGASSSVLGTANGGGSKDLRRWLQSNRSGYEFSVGNPEDAAFKAGKPKVARPPVGSAHLPAPPVGEGEAPPPSSSGGGDEAQTNVGWRAETHAPGSSRPWAVGVDRWGRDQNTGRKGRGKRRWKTRGDPGGTRAEKKYDPNSESGSKTDDPEFPFWALSDEDLPVNFKLKK